MLTIIMIEIIYDGREGATSKNKGKFLEWRVLGHSILFKF